MFEMNFFLPMMLYLRYKNRLHYRTRLRKKMFKNNRICNTIPLCGMLIDPATKIGTTFFLQLLHLVGKCTINSLVISANHLYNCIYSSFNIDNFNFNSNGEYKISIAMAFLLQILWKKCIQLMS